MCIRDSLISFRPLKAVARTKQVNILFRDNIAGMQRLVRDVYKRQVEMNDIRLLELRKRGNVRTCIGDVHGKDILLFEAVGFPRCV